MSIFTNDSEILIPKKNFPLSPQEDLVNALKNFEKKARTKDQIDNLYNIMNDNFIKFPDYLSSINKEKQEKSSFIVHSFR